MLDTPSTEPGRGLCLEVHDLVVSKLVAGREKDFDFAAALLRAGLVDAGTVIELVGLLAVEEKRRETIRRWVQARS